MKIQVAVCVITYKRPEGLNRLIDGLNKLIFNKCDPPDLEIIVVDNDLTGSARTFCESVGSSIQWPLRYYIESRRGISYARNKAVECVSKDIDFIAFVDDDEVPETIWLEELLYVQRLYNADVVSGPVLPYFNEPVPNWVIKGKFFERSRYPTGHSLKFTATNNVLIRSEIFKKMDKIFDERFALTGGSDTHFFMRVNRAGYKIVQANDALVYEWIPKSRANMRWVLQRAYRTGNTVSLCKLELEPSVTVGAVRAVKGGGRIIQGLLLMPLSLLLGSYVFIKALQCIYRGAGIIAGLVGRRYEEYQKTHGE